LIGMFIAKQTNFDKRFKYFRFLMLTFLIHLIICVAIPLMAWMAGEEFKECRSLVYCLVCVSAIVGGASFARMSSLAAEFPPTCYPAFLTGIATGTFIPTLLNFAFMFSVEGRNLLSIVFSLSSLVILFSMFRLYKLSKRDVFQYYVIEKYERPEYIEMAQSQLTTLLNPSDEADSNYLVLKRSKKKAMARIFGILFSTALSVSMALISTTAFVDKIPKEQFSGILLVVYTFGDILGRPFLMKVTIPDKALWILVFIRVAFVPLIILQFAKEFIPSVAFTLLIFLLLAFTNGLVVSGLAKNIQILCHEKAPQRCTLVAIMITIAFQIGSMIALLLAPIFGHIVQSLGPNPDEG